MARADGGTDLKVSVRAAPEGGRANDALIRLLAEAWDLPRGRLSLVTGLTDRHKTVLVQGDPARLMAQLSAWLTERFPP